MANEQRFYWLKLKRDFFKRHDIRIIEGMPNGKDYVLFYLKLLCESVDHDGNLRFSEKIPYSEEMLATITDTNVDIVRSAVNMFVQLGMMELMDDGTFFMTEVMRMTGSAVDSDGANRVRRFREKQKETFLLEQRTVTNCNASVTDSVTKDNESKSKRKELDKEKEKEKDDKRKRFTPPTLEEVQAYCKERKNNVDAKKFFDYYQEGEWHDSQGKPVRNWKQKLLRWEKDDTQRQTQKKKPMDERELHEEDYEHGYYSDIMNRPLRQTN